MRNGFRVAWPHGRRTAGLGDVAVDGACRPLPVVDLVAPPVMIGLVVVLTVVGLVMVDPPPAPVRPVARGRAPPGAAHAPAGAARSAARRAASRPCAREPPRSAGGARRARPARPGGGRRARVSGRAPPFAASPPVGCA